MNQFTVAYTSGFEKYFTLLAYCDIWLVIYHYFIYFVICRAFSLQFLFAYHLPREMWQWFQKQNFQTKYT